MEGISQKGSQRLPPQPTASASTYHTAMVLSRACKSVVAIFTSHAAISLSGCASNACNNWLCAAPAILSQPAVLRPPGHDAQHSHCSGHSFAGLFGLADKTANGCCASSRPPLHADCLFVPQIAIARQYCTWNLDNVHWQA